MPLLPVFNLERFFSPIGDNCVRRNERENERLEDSRKWKRRKSTLPKMLKNKNLCETLLDQTIRNHLELGSLTPDQALTPKASCSPPPAPQTFRQSPLSAFLLHLTLVLLGRVNTLNRGGVCSSSLISLAEGEKYDQSWGL